MGIVAISFASIFIRLAQAQGVPTLSIAAWRLIFASMVLLPYTWATSRDEIRDLSRLEWGLLGASGLFLGLHFASWIGSLGYTSVTSSVVLTSMGPIFVGLGSWIFLRERPGLQMVVGMILAAAGSIVISWGDFGQGRNQLLGDLLALIGAIMIAAYLMIGRKVRGRHSLTAYIGLVYGVAMVTLIVIVLLGRQPMSGFGLEAFGWMIALGLVPQLIGHSTLNWALRYLSATFVSIVVLSEPIGSGILAYVILREPVTWSTAAGGAVVLAGIYIASRAEMARSAGQQPMPAIQPMERV
jgi:drug/metabolite transporter (DMT)-like permease